MITQTSFEYAHVIRVDSCSSADIKKSLTSKMPQESKVPSEQPCKTVKRRVSFHSLVAVRSIARITDYSLEEIVATWYQRREYKQMRAAFCVTVGLLQSERYTGDTDDHCARGLEHRLRPCSQKRRVRKLTSILAVLGEQEQQRYCCEDATMSTLALAAVYGRAVGASRYEASQRGELDAEEVSRISAGKESLTTLLFRASNPKVEQEIRHRKEAHVSAGKPTRNPFRKIGIK